MRTHKLVRDRLGPWISERLGAPSSVLGIAAPTGAGFSAETLLLDVKVAETTRGFVVRFENAPQSSLFMNPDIGFQFRMLEALADAGGPPTPEPVGLEDDEAILGARFTVVVRLPGRAVHQNPNYNVGGWVKALTAEERTMMWSDAIAAMARLHKLTPAPRFAFLDQPQLGADSIAQALASLQRYYDWVRRGKLHPLVEIAMNRLERDRPSGIEDSVLWGDAHVSNMLFDGGRVSGVLDWEVASIGPREYDLAWWLYFQDLQSRGLGHALLPGIPDRGQTLQLYEEASGRKLRHFAYYELLAHTRIAILSMRSVYRQVDIGAIPEDTKATTHNPGAKVLAETLGEPPPEVGEDFAAYLAAVIGRKNNPTPSSQ